MLVYLIKTILTRVYLCGSKFFSGTKSSLEFFSGGNTVEYCVVRTETYCGFDMVDLFHGNDIMVTIVKHISCPYTVLRTAEF